MYALYVQDVEMIGWMERELKRNELAVVLVTHDRHVCAQL